jgi:predicted metal-dependent enzyme (double-stranded beta helix superfamily)
MLWPFDLKYSRKLERISLDFIALILLQELLRAGTIAGVAQENPRLQELIAGLDSLVERTRDEAVLLREGSGLLRTLVAREDWLPQSHTRAPAHGYAQYLLHCDPRKRFCIVSFVWSPGARTPIHDHTVWGMIGVLRGAENCYEYDWPKTGTAMQSKARHRLDAGSIDHVSPGIGDIHVVENAVADAPSVSIHVYGGDIGAIERHVFDPHDGSVKRFVSGYTPLG